MKKVLIVDDSLTIIESIIVILKNENIESDVATSGVEAVEFVKNNKYDMVFLDIMMPKMDGNETLWHFERDRNLLADTTPIIAITSNDYNGARDEYISRGYTDYIPKPITAANIIEILTRYNMI